MRRTTEGGELTIADQTPGQTLSAMGGKHHRSWVGPPEYFDRVGALQFIVLVLLGMREHHKLLDIGCGSLRGGRFAIMYLAEGHYFGLEPERWALEQGITHELSSGLAELKKPNFTVNSDFSLDEFNCEFDFALASGIFTHAGNREMADCFAAVAASLAPDGVFVGAFMEGDTDSQHDHWTYPEIQRYTPGRLAAAAAEVGLHVQFVDWPHPFDHRWFVASRSAAEVPTRLDLSMLSWHQYLTEEIIARGGARRDYQDYLKEELNRRVTPDDVDRLLPQVLR